MNVIRNEPRIDKKTGEIKAPVSFSMDILSEEQKENGDKSMELVKVRIKDFSKLESFKAFLGKSILLSVGKMDGSSAVGADGYMVRGRELYFSRPDSFPILFTPPKTGTGA
jgi:hypothetical protein